MAVDSNAWFSNSIQGVPGIGPLEFNIFGQSTTPKHAVGHKVETQDGRVFRYAQFGAATAQGLVVSQDISESGAAEDAITVVAPASAATTTDGTVGSRFIEGTISAITTDLYAGGHLAVIAGTGRGYTHRVKGNTATGLGVGGPASGNIRIELYEPLQATLTAVSDVNIVGSKYANLEAATAGTDELIVGVTIDNMAVNTYGWIQTRGPCAVQQDNTNALTLGSIVVLSDTTAGQVKELGKFLSTGSLSQAAKEPIIGNTLSISTAAANGTYAIVDLIIG